MFIGVEFMLRRSQVGKAEDSDHMPVASETVRLWQVQAGSDHPQNDAVLMTRPCEETGGDPHFIQNSCWRTSLVTDIHQDEYLIIPQIGSC